MPPFRNHRVPSNTIVTPVIDVDAKLGAKDPFRPVQDGLRRIAECRAQLAAVNERARDAVTELRNVEAQLLRQAIEEVPDPAAEADLIQARDAARAAVDPELHHARVQAAEGRIQAAIDYHDREIVAHLDELLQALEPERVAAEEALEEAEERIAPVRQRVQKVHDRIRELEQYGQPHQVADPPRAMVG